MTDRLAAQDGRVWSGGLLCGYGQTRWGSALLRWWGATRDHIAVGEGEGELRRFCNGAAGEGEGDKTAY